MSNCDVFLQMYADVANGPEVYPRGSVCREVQAYSFELDMADNPVTSFNARKLNLDYARQEFLWYLRADKFDASIEQYATMWKKIKQPDGSYYSNYGQYLFPNQFEFVVNELIRDQWSRRASMVLLKPEHLFHENSDVVCTYAINFSIRNGQLNMIVHMRSNDVIFGTTNDVFCFSMIYRMVYAMLKGRIKYLFVGSYVHIVDSLHVYDRHYDMIKQILLDGSLGYSNVMIPWPSYEEAHQSSKGRGLIGDGLWSRWLLRD